MKTKRNIYLFGRLIKRRKYEDTPFTVIKKSGEDVSDLYVNSDSKDCLNKYGLEYPKSVIASTSQDGYLRYIRRIDELSIRFKGDFSKMKEAIRNGNFNDKWKGQYCGADFEDILKVTNTKRLTIFDEEYIDNFFKQDAPFVLYYHGNKEDIDAHETCVIINNNSGCRIYFNEKDPDKFLAAESFEELMCFEENMDKILPRLASRGRRNV